MNINKQFEFIFYIFFSINQRYVLKDVTLVTGAALHPITAGVFQVGLVTTVRKVFRLPPGSNYVQKST